MEPNSPKKIQFSVPLFQSQLDPQAAEHIRKRRPTPATLVIYNEPSASGDDKQTTGNQTEAQSAQLSPAQRKQSVYTPPTMREAGKMGKRKDLSEFDKGQIVMLDNWVRTSPKLQLLWGVPELQLVVEQHFQRQEQQEAGLSDSPDTPSPITAQHFANEAQWANHNSSEPNGNESYVSTEGQPGSSGAGGVKVLKTQADPTSLFQEDEENSGERKDSQTE
ncbi:Protein phosphatase 1 regulatory subunit 1C [Anabarilius grahami]|uniref:Protein phosphatase 1 regulatory subunit 1C n=1 Tax=Anabarilius grahami TaxID=495550 RepID=A0A3N0YW25_ANAGA|nr:Protein phosphatase 1 regulatory subunit 1C [Anabarilius grahami]